jgi:peroxiredoxin
VAFLTFDDVAPIARFAEGSRITYPMLSDKGSRIIRALGVENKAFGPGSFAHGVAHPAIFVMDAKGVLRLRFAEEDYTDRPMVDAVLGAAKRLP